MPLQIRRGTQGERDQLVIANVPLAMGEPLWETTNKRLYIGDGETPGGVLLEAETTVDLSDYEGAINLDGTVQGNIIPNANQIYDLGSATRRFKDLWLSGNSLRLGNAQISAAGTAINLPAGSTIDGSPIGSGSGGGFAEGNNYRINILGSDSSVIVDSATGTLNGDLFGNVTGDVVGSIFGDDSTILVDSVNNLIVGNVVNQSVTTDRLTGSTIFLSGLDQQGIPTGIDIKTEYNQEYPANVLKIQGAFLGSSCQSFLFSRSRGTLSDPLNVQNGDLIFRFDYVGIDTNGDGAFVGGIQALVDDNVSAGIVPGKIEIYTSNSSGSVKLGLSIDSKQVIGVANNTLVAGSGSGEVDNGSVSTYLKINVGGFDYALPLYSINP